MRIYTITMTVDDEASTLAFREMAEVTKELNAIVEWEGALTREQWNELICGVESLETSDEACLTIYVIGGARFLVTRHTL